MIWHSALLMTTIDVVMVLGALKALQVLFRHRATIRDMKIARPVQAIAAGLCIISGYYLTDLYTMLVMPLYGSDEAAMAVMRNLHLHWGWLVVLTGFAAIVVGLAYLAAKLFPQIATIIKRLEAEVVERNRAQDALRESEEQRRLITDNVPAAIAYVDANQRYGSINRRYEEWFGISSEDAYGRRVRDVLGEAAYDAVKENLAQALSGERIAFETSLPIKNAVTRHVQATYVPHPSNDGGIKGVFVLITDITERKRLEGELLRRERLATLGQLTATVSHELRNPLGVIRTSAFILRDGLNEAMPRAYRALERVERSVMRCDRIIDEMLDFTRISDLEPEPTALDDWLAGVLEEQPLPTGISLRQELQLPETTVPLDRDRFRRAVINVFDNACQAMLGAGTSETKPAERLLTVRTRECDGRIEVVFEDQGPGIARHVYERIFEPLYSTKGLGLGLGLPVVKQIMEQHGGGIEIETEEGRGTAVCLWLDRNARAENVAA